MYMEELNFLAEDILKKIMHEEDVPAYLNRAQLAEACSVKVPTVQSWSDKKQLPDPDLIVGPKHYWLPSTIAPFIQQYRKGK